MKKMVLVEGEVTYKIKITTLVDEETAQDEDRMKDIFENLGYKDIEYFGECEVKYTNEIPVTIDEELCEKYAEDNLGSNAYNEIINRSK